MHREFCFRRGKKYQKDISRLGRNLERVVHIDHEHEAVCRYPENAIVIPSWDGDEDDTYLLDMIEFLKAAMHQP